jgi:hypothetical protein
MPVRSSKAIVLLLAFALDTMVLEMPCQIAVSVATRPCALTGFFLEYRPQLGVVCCPFQLSPVDVCQVNTQNPIDSLRFWHFFLNLYVDIKPAIFVFT